VAEAGGYFFLAIFFGAAFFFAGIAFDPPSQTSESLPARMPSAHEKRGRVIGPPPLFRGAYFFFAAFFFAAFFLAGILEIPPFGP
jgi:hypothetical protein